MVHPFPSTDSTISGKVSVVFLSPFIPTVAIVSVSVLVFGSIPVFELRVENELSNALSGKEVARLKGEEVIGMAVEARENLIY